MTDTEYKAKVQALDWNGITELWKQIVECDTPGWAPGKAFEYLVMRIFELDGLEVKYPFSVRMPNNGNTMEQIDGVVYIDGLAVLIESKDYSDKEAKLNVDFWPIAKLRSQLQRRPYVTMGSVFSAGGFTEAVSALIEYLGNDTILLWQGQEVDYCIRAKKVKDYFKIKLRNRVEHGIHDFNIAILEA